MIEFVEEQFKNIEHELVNPTSYLRFSDVASIKKDLTQFKIQIYRLKNFILEGKVKKLRDRITTLESDLHYRKLLSNEKFIALERLRAKDVFQDREGSEYLTNEQLEAVLCDDDRNLIIAGAGSGKTRVIDFKIQYLVNHKKVSADRILLLSFSKKSVRDLKDKILKSAKNVNVSTIHSFSLSIAGKGESEIFNKKINEQNLYIITSLAQTLKNEKNFKKFEMFYEKFFSDVKPFIFYNNLNDLRSDLKKSNIHLLDKPDQFGEIIVKRGLKTLRGELVRSIDERYIADFLYLHNIKYTYEKKYPDKNISYYPDFYLNDYDIYLEHYAITTSGQPPKYFDNPQKYLDSIVWKRQLHKDKGTRIIESFSYLLNSARTSQYLSDLLGKNGINVTNEGDKTEVYSKISKEFCQIFINFYTTFKLSGLSIDELRRTYKTQKYSLYLDIFESFLNIYDQNVKRDHKIDFNDLVIKSITENEEKKLNKYDYIIIDEFQDTSNLAMEFLDNMMDCNPKASFLCVGDDWQSIYGFNGSDVTIISNYDKKYSGVSLKKLNNNFRSHSKIVKLGKEFISKNPAQIKKNVVSKNEKIHSSEIRFLPYSEMENIIELIPDNESIFVLYRYNDDCPAANGIFRNYFWINDNKPVKREGCKKNISLMTIHASKGLEAQHVFFVFPDGLKRKFPSEIEDHYIFNMLKKNNDPYPFSEERRLMYVAITRAEQNLYFVSCNEKEPDSIFWNELIDLTHSL